MKLVERAVCFRCGDWVLARVNLSGAGSGTPDSLTCPVCATTFARPDRVVPAPETVDDGFFAHVYVGDRYSVIEVGGEIDISTAVRFRDIALEALADRPERVVVDMTGVDFMDSTGLAVLVLLRKRTRARDVPLAVVSNSRIDRLLHVSGMDQTLEMHTALADAVGPQATTS